MSGRRVMIVVEDLFFATRIATTAEHVGVDVERVEASRAVERCRAHPPDLVILDLHGPGDPLAVARELKAHAETRQTPIVGYYSHVEQALRDAAIAAGVDRVLARSAFTVRLADLLTKKA